MALNVWLSPSAIVALVGATAMETRETVGVLALALALLLLSPPQAVCSSIAAHSATSLTGEMRAIGFMNLMSFQVNSGGSLLV